VGLEFKSAYKWYISKKSRTSAGVGSREKDRKKEEKN
jgi:hypothetical protein